MCEALNLWTNKHITLFFETLCIYTVIVPITSNKSGAYLYPYLGFRWP